MTLKLDLSVKQTANRGLAYIARRPFRLFSFIRKLIQVNMLVSCELIVIAKMTHYHVTRPKRVSNSVSDGCTAYL